MAGFMDFLSNILGNYTVPRADVRNPAQQAVGGQLMNEYAQAHANPNYGIGTPEQQLLMEQQLSDDIKARAGASGGGFSGNQQDLVRKGIIDFRIGQIANRQRALDSLRTAMVQSTAPTMAPGDEVEGPAQAAKGVLGTRAAQGFGDALFGNPQANAAKSMQSATNNPPQGGNQPGGMNAGRPDYQPT